MVPLVNSDLKMLVSRFVNTTKDLALFIRKRNKINLTSRNNKPKMLTSSAVRMVVEERVILWNGAGMSKLTIKLEKFILEVIFRKIIFVLGTR